MKARERQYAVLGLGVFGRSEVLRVVKVWG